MELRIIAMCRGAGTASVKVVLSGIPAGSSLESEVVVRGECVVPSRLIVLAGAHAGSAQDVLVEFPLLDVEGYGIWVRAIGPDGAATVAGASVSADELKWRSRIDRRVRRAFMEEVGRDGARMRQRCLRLEYERCIPDGDRVIVRVRCVVPQVEKPRSLTLKVYSREGDLVAVPFYETDAMFDDAGLSPAPVCWTIGYSVPLPVDFRGFCLGVHDESGSLQDGFRTLEDPVRDVLEGEFLRDTANAACDDAYDRWFRARRIDDIALERQRATHLAFEPCISIIVPLFDTPLAFFAEMYASVACQSYAGWQLVLVNASPENQLLAAALASLDDERVVVVTLERNRGIVGNTWAGIDVATGDYIAFLDHDDFLEEDALFEYVRVINEDPGCDAFYCDEDCFWEDGRFVAPLLKPGFDRDWLYMHNYIAHFLVIRADFVRHVGPSPDYVEGAQDYDLVLRVLDAGARFRHIARVLYHWRSHPDSTSANAESKPYAVEAGRRALEDHFRRRRLNVQVLSGRRLFTYREVYALPGHPLVSVVVPLDGRLPVAGDCVGALLARATYGNYEVVVVEYGDAGKAADVSSSAAWFGDMRVKVVRADAGSGLAAAVNCGVRQTCGEFVFLLGNDVKVATADVLEQFLGYFSREEVGVVGGKVLFPDGTVQHAGITLRPSAGPQCLYHGVPDGFEGYLREAVLSCGRLAVSGACHMTRRSVFEELGGYDERFEAAYADVDFCLRVREAGYAVVYDAFAKLHRSVFASSSAGDLFCSPGAGRDRKQVDLQRLREKWPRYLGAGDPAAGDPAFGDPSINPNLDGESLYGGLGGLVPAASALLQ